MGCNSKKDKNELIRIVKNNKNEITVDKTGKLEGRGAYICNSMECLEKAIKSRRIEKAIEAKISDEIFEQLKSLINGGEYIG
ncbi:MAG: YlxR family protein [Clostridia bacterium]|jgi:predicted RNA-binding protein YlxR (DUF448 family)|nr:YlxR family protein [Clostridia bacterium]